MNQEHKTIQNELENSDFTLDNNFLDAFYDPIPKGLNKSIYLMFIILTVFNVLALVIMLYLFWYRPKRARLNIPKTNIADLWLNYAERNLKFRHHNEIIEGYTKAIQLDKENIIYNLKYYKYLAEYAVYNKLPATGRPFGHKVEETPKLSFENLIKWLTKYIELRPKKKFENDKIFTLASWFAFDLHYYKESIFYGKYSLEIKEYSISSKKDVIQLIELYYLLAGSSFKNNNKKEAIEFILIGLDISGKFNLKSGLAMGWEILGECFYKAKNYSKAKNCFLSTLKFDKRRWISFYRLYWIFKKENNILLAKKYQDKYISLQKELGPI